MNKKILKLIIIVGVVLISIIYIVVSNHNQDNYANIYISSENIVNAVISETFEETEEKIKVHITGEVNNPGIYELFEGDRIENAIIAAGGETENADLSKVNLAYELSDGQKIYIPSIFDEETAYIYNDAGDSVIVEDSDRLQHK